MGELSLFHETFGYYAHGVDETTAVLPSGWKERLVRVENENTMGARRHGFTEGMPGRPGAQIPG